MLPVGAQVRRQRVLPPGRLARRGDRRERGYRAVALRVADADDDRAVAAHRVAADRFARRIDRQVGVHDGRQLVANVVVHAVVRGPGRLRRVDVETGAGADVHLRVLARNVDAARARVRNDQRETELRGIALRPRFDAEVLLRAGETRQPVQRRDRRALGGRRQVHGETHRAGAGRRHVLVDDLAALEAARLADPFDGRLGHSRIPRRLAHVRRPCARTSRRRYKPPSRGMHDSRRIT